MPAILGAPRPSKCNPSRPVARWNATERWDLPFHTSHTHHALRSQPHHLSQPACANAKTALIATIRCHNGNETDVARRTLGLASVRLPFGAFSTCTNVVFHIQPDHPGTRAGITFTGLLTRSPCDLALTLRLTMHLSYVKLLLESCESRRVLCLAETGTERTRPSSPEFSRLLAATCSY
jgi:hypothetical protein